MQKHIGEVAVNAQNSSPGINTGNVGINREQLDFNGQVEGRLDEIDRELHRLQRIDIRMNKTLVSKPYTYIDDIRDNLVKE